MKAFGISGRNLVESEVAFIEKWTGNYGFSIELVTEACKRTMQAIHQPSFEYTDSILGNWHKKHGLFLGRDRGAGRSFFKPEAQTAGSDGKRARIPANNRFNNFDQRPYDYRQLEEQVFNHSTH